MANDETPKDDKVTQLPQGKTPVDQSVNKIFDSEKKSKQAELDKAVADVHAAKKVLINALETVNEKKAEIAEIEKTDIDALAKALGV